MVSLRGTGVELGERVNKPMQWPTHEQPVWQTGGGAVLPLQEPAAPGNLLAVWQDPSQRAEARVSSGVSNCGASLRSTPENALTDDGKVGRRRPHDVLVAIGGKGIFARLGRVAGPDVNVLDTIVEVTGYTGYQYYEASTTKLSGNQG